MTAVQEKSRGKELEGHVPNSLQYSGIISFPLSIFQNLCTVLLLS